MNNDNVIPLHSEVRIGEFAISLTVPRVTFDRMVNEILNQLPAMLLINDGGKFMRYFGSTEFDARRILNMMDKSHDAESTAFILAGILNANDGRPSAVQTVMYILMNTAGADKTEVAANMYVLQQYFSSKNQKFM